MNLRQSRFLEFSLESTVLRNYLNGSLKPTTSDGIVASSLFCKKADYPL